MIVGYTTGVFDLFHIGHLNILRNAKSVCDKLIVGVTIDEYVEKYKDKRPITPFAERIEIVKSIKYVDEVVPQVDHDKLKAWEKYKFNVMLVGDDWKNTDKWNSYEESFQKKGVKIIYFPRTEGVSSSLLKSNISKKNLG